MEKMVKGLGIIQNNKIVRFDECENTTLEHIKIELPESTVKEINSSQYAIHNLDGSIDIQLKELIDELNEIELDDNIDTDLAIEENTIVTNELVHAFHQLRNNETIIREVLIDFMMIVSSGKIDKPEISKLAALIRKLPKAEEVKLVNGNNIKTIANNAKKKHIQEIENQLKGVG